MIQVRVVRRLQNQTDAEACDTATEIYCDSGPIPGDPNNAQLANNLQITLFLGQGGGTSCGDFAYKSDPKDGKKDNPNLIISGYNQGKKGGFTVCTNSNAAGWVRIWDTQGDGGQSDVIGGTQVLDGLEKSKTSNRSCSVFRKTGT